MTGKSEHPVFDNFAVTAFNLWAKHGNAKIVFSTNWALSFSEDELKEIMKVNGLAFDYHEHCITPKRMRSERNNEITSWLSMYADDDCKFIAVDDDYTCRAIEEIINHDKWECKNKNISGKWINVDLNNGITLDNFWDGLDVFGVTKEDLMEQEFGIKRLTAEEKIERQKALDMLMRCAV